jgi:O-antigen/teichoic acid export membrane protein
VQPGFLRGGDGQYAHLLIAHFTSARSWCYNAAMKLHMRQHALVLLGLLVVQYVIGMLTNLFVAFPEGNTDWQQWDFLKTQGVAMLHIALGMVLLLGAIWFFVRAIRSKNRSWKLSAGAGLASIILAIISGSEFVSLQKEAYSLAMAVFFIGAVVAYGWGMYSSRAYES